MRALAASTLLICLVLAGCSGKGGPEASPTESTFATEPTTGSETGAIQGTVLDEESLPLADVGVQVRPGNNTTKTDAVGKFVFSELSPGSYEVLFNALGYESEGRKVEVAAGAVTDANVTLRQVVVIEAWNETVPWTGHITAGEAFVDIITGGLGIPGCDACVQTFDTTADVLSIVLELSFTPTVTNPTGPNELEYQLWDTANLNSGDLSLEAYAAGAWTNGAKLQVNKSKFPEMWDADGDNFTMVHYCDTEFVCVDQTFTVYVTFFHNAEAPADFSAIPKS